MAKRKAATKRTASGSRGRGASAKSSSKRTSGSRSQSRSGPKKRSTKGTKTRGAFGSKKKPFKKTTGGPKRPIKKTRGRRSAADSDQIRLQKFLASAGYGSRRDCETLIEEGRVMVDKEMVDQLGTRVNPEKQKIFVDGERVVPERLEYYILNKPPGVVSTSRDPAGRLRVIDLIKTKQRVYNVGRLDKSSEGLILVTNDGELANRLTHPSFGVAKTYQVQVEGEPTRETIKSLLQGLYLAEGFAKMANVKIKRKQKNTSWLEIVLEEGRNREIRRLLAKVGHKVLRLRRTAIGPIRLAELPLGAHRRLEYKELKALKYSARKKPADRKPRGGGSPRKPGGRKSPASSRDSGDAKRPARKKSAAGKKPTFGKKAPSGRRTSTSGKPSFGKKSARPKSNRSGASSSGRPARKKPAGRKRSVKK